MEKCITTRDETYDITKGILIALVVLGHALQYGWGINYMISGEYYNNWLFRSIYCFHMPAFMFISGFFFYTSIRKTTIRKVLLSRFTTIGIPFLTFYSIIYICELYTSNFSLIEYIKLFFNMFGSTMWFLSSLLINCTIVGIIENYLKRFNIFTRCIVWLLIISSLICSPIAHNVGKFIFMLPFFLIGYYMQHIGFKISNNLFLLLLLSILYIYGVILFDKDTYIYTTGISIIRGESIDIRQIYIDIIRYIIGMIGTFWILFTVNYLKKYHETFLFKNISNFGKKSLAIYGFQSIFYLFLIKVYQKCSINFSLNYIWIFILFTIIFLLCELSITICKKYRLLKILFLGKR